MEDKKETARELIEKFYQLINKFNGLEKIPYDFRIGEASHPSEIHTIQAIGKNNWIKVTALANRLCDFTKYISGITDDHVDWFRTVLDQVDFYIDRHSSKYFFTPMV